MNVSSEIFKQKWRNPKKIIQALATHGPMSKWQLKEKTELKYPRVHEAVTKLENDGYIKVFDEVTSDKGLSVKIYGLTFLKPSMQRQPREASEYSESNNKPKRSPKNAFFRKTNLS